MTERYLQLIEKLKQICVFCPVCGDALLVTTWKSSITNSGAADGEQSGTYKQCPSGHVSIDVDPEWNVGKGTPEAVMEFDPALFIDI